jgi:hypothetical protein
MNRDKTEERLLARRKVMKTLLTGAAVAVGGALLTSQTVKAMTDDSDCAPRHKHRHKKAKHHKKH